jgi:NADH-quinone oxidoreductase subunit M
MNVLLHPLTLVTFFPLVGILVILFLKPGQKNIIRWVALITSLVTFGISLWVLAQFNASSPDLQLELDVPWIQVASWDISYHLGIDGLSVLLVLLTTFLTPISILSTWSAVEERVKDFMVFFLLLEIGMVGVFIAQDLFYSMCSGNFLVFVFLIGVWVTDSMYAAISSSRWQVRS